MKKTLLSSIALATVIFVASCANAPESDKATTTEAKAEVVAKGAEYKVDTASSIIEWVGTKVTGKHNGTLNIKNGTINVEAGAVTGGKFTIDMTSMKVTDANTPKEFADKLLGHLKSPDFFEVDKNPEATFVITSVKAFSGTLADTSLVNQEAISKYKVDNPTHTVAGNLTIKGISKNIEFPAKITVADGSVEAVAKFNIDRTKWNLIYPGKPDDLIRNDIHLGISIKSAK